MSECFTYERITVAQNDFEADFAKCKHFPDAKHLAHAADAYRRKLTGMEPQRRNRQWSQLAVT